MVRELGSGFLWEGAPGASAGAGLSVLYLDLGCGYISLDM